MSRAVRVRITGLVQGVGYRDWTRREAMRRGLDGWVRNRSDRSVEALFSGPDDAVMAMLEACRHGPPAARVAEVSQADGAEPVPSGFAVLPSL